MTLVDFFLSRNKNTANIAKERLQIIVAERRKKDSNEPHFLPQLKNDILEVICKYTKINPDMVTIRLEHKEEDISILELNIELIDTEKIIKF